jgi:hypothetical protein
VIQRGEREFLRGKRGEVYKSKRYCMLKIDINLLLCNNISKAKVRKMNFLYFCKLIY